MKRYRLLRELPTFHAGDIFTLGEDGCLYLTEPCDFNHHWKSRVMAYHKNTLASFPNILEDWFEEIEEPKESEYYWYIGYKNDIRRTKYHHMSDFADNQVTATRKEIGNCFKSLEEAELALRKLKAWKRLKDKGFRYRDWDTSHHNLGAIEFFLPDIVNDFGKYRNDLDLLFSGGEE